MLSKNAISFFSRVLDPYRDLGASLQKVSLKKLSNTYYIINKYFVNSIKNVCANCLMSVIKIVPFAQFKDAANQNCANNNCLFAFAK